MARSAKHPALKEDEDGFAEAVADYLRAALPSDFPWWHTPNGGERPSVERVNRRTGKTYRYSPQAERLKRMGTRPGVPDLTFILPNGQAAFIELKVGANDLSTEQEDLREDLIARHCGYAVCRTPEEVESTLTRWLAAFGMQPRARLQRSAA